jgi:small subunit ribosomal protein S16
LAVHIRLLRMGKKKQPFYRIVAADSRRARDGRFLEIIGTYNPITKPAQVKLAEDRITHWLNRGAIPSDTVASLFTQTGFTEKYHRAKKGEDVSGIEVKATIMERPKKTRKMKKAAVAKAEEEKAQAEAKAKAEAAPAEGGEEAAAAPAEGGEAAAEEGEKTE